MATRAILLQGCYTSSPPLLVFSPCLVARGFLPEGGRIMRHSRGTLVVSLLLAALVALGYPALDQQQAQSAKPQAKTISLYAKTTPAQNAPHLVLHDDGA